MNYAQYISLINELELSAVQNRSFYEKKVVGLALLGYSYFVLLLLLFVSVPLFIAFLAFLNPAAFLKILLWTAKLWWAVIPAAIIYFGALGGAVRSYFRNVPEPELRELRKEEAPELFDYVSSTCRSLSAAVPKQIFITDEFNAAVITTPRFGMFGKRVYMSIGLPLMQALSVDQFKAVLAHEIGHISGKHGGYGKWAYQLHESWNRFIESQQMSGYKLDFLYERFVNWFFPYFQAYSFVLMREHEKEADGYAVDIAGGKALGESLILLQTRSAYMEKAFWNEIEDENRKSPVASQNIFSRMMGSLLRSDQSMDEETLQKAIKIPTDYNDSHPALSDRLKAIGYWDGQGVPAMPDPAPAYAAEYFLGDHKETLVAEFEAIWNENISETWKQRHEYFKTSEKRFEELESKSSNEELSVAELIEKAGLVAQQHGNPAALPIIREALEREPENPEAVYLFGGILLEQENDEGLDHLRKAMQLDSRWKYPASEAAFQYLRFHGRLTEAAEFADVLENQAKEFEKASLERQSVSVNDVYLPHSYDEKSVAEIVQKVRYYDEIEELFLVAKQTELYKEVPFHVLFIEMRKKSRFSKNNDLSDQDLLNAVVDRLEPFEIGYFAVFDGEIKPIQKNVENIPGALIYKKES